jgi:hypothetical protein
MMKHVFEIKDFVATAESAKRIMMNQINVILKAKDDLNITAIRVFVNDTDAKFYDKKYEEQNVSFVPTLFKGKKKSSTKQTFAAFHNSVINNIAQDISSDDTIVHIQDGTLDLTDLPSERGICKTRLGEMVQDVVYLMKLLDHPVWFNTASDKGNMKFGHYYTLIDLLNIDDTCLFETIPNCIMYAGNSNLDWIIVNGKEYLEKKMPTLMMNGSYDYDFLSIKHLIAKFANYENGYFDNMFPTIPMEVGSYFRNPEFDRDLQQYDMSKYKANLENYRENLKEYKQLKNTTLNDAVKFVRDKLLTKLSESDKEKLHLFESGI